MSGKSLQGAETEQVKVKVGHRRTFLKADVMANWDPCILPGELAGVYGVGREGTGMGGGAMQKSCLETLSHPTPVLSFPFPLHPCHFPSNPSNPQT